MLSIFKHKTPLLIHIEMVNTLYDIFSQAKRGRSLKTDFHGDTNILDRFINLQTSKFWLLSKWSRSFTFYSSFPRPKIGEGHFWILAFMKAPTGQIDFWVLGPPFPIFDFLQNGQTVWHIWNKLTIWIPIESNAGRHTNRFLCTDIVNNF